MSISMIPPLENVDVDVNNINSLFKTQAIPDNINDYKFENKIGEGRFGKVRTAIHKSTNLKVAIKIIDKNQIKLKEDRQRVDSEISILKQVKHYNISKLFSCIESEERIYLVEEYVNGNDLNVFIKQKEKPKIREQKVLTYFRQIISAIEYIHKLGIAHRDLKPENILINNKNDIKLIDFGLGKMFTKGQLLKTQCGSPFYASPEMINGNKYNGVNSDIWSLGVILYLMLFEELPFMDADMKRLYKKISTGKYEIPEDKLDEVSSEAIDLVKQILEVNPKNRIKISEIKSHPWFNQISNVLYEGINTKETILPIDEEIVEDINKNYGFEKMRIRNSIIRNFYNHITSLYFILLEKKIKQGKESVSDLCSKLYLDYVNDDKNKLINYENIEGILKERMNSKEKLEVIPDYEENKEFLNMQQKKNIIGRRRRTQIIDINDICNIQNDSKLNNELIKIKKKKKNEKTNRNDNNNLLYQANTNTKKSKFGTFNKTKTHDSDSMNLKEYKQKLSERVNIEINRSISKREICSDSRRDKSENIKLSSGKNKKIGNLKIASANQKKLLTNHNTNAHPHFNNNSVISKSNKNMNKSRTNKKPINNKKNKHDLFVSCDDSKPIDKKALGHILYKNNDTGTKRNNELYSTNKSLLDKINLNKKSESNKNVTNLNKNNINERNITTPTKSIEVSESKKKGLLQFLDNSRSSKIKKRFYINKKLSTSSSLPNDSPNKYKMIQGKTMSNFYKNKNIINNNYESTKISVKNIKSHNNHKGKTAKIENKTVSMMKGKKTQKILNFKTNSNFLKRKQRNINSIQKDINYLESEKTGNTNISNSNNNLDNVNSAVNLKNKINNENIVVSKKILNTFSTMNNFNINQKDNNKGSLITNFTSREKSNSKDKKIMVNITKKDSKITSPKNDKILISTIKKPKNKKRNINLNENKVNLNLNDQNNFDEKKIVNYEHPFDLNCLIVSKNKVKIKETFEKYLNHKKISFICEKDKTNNNKNQISFNCSKKNGAKFSVKLSKIKTEYNGEDNNLYIFKIKKISDVKYDYYGLINF